MSSSRRRVKMTVVKMMGGQNDSRVQDRFSFRNADWQRTGTTRTNDRGREILLWYVAWFEVPIGGRAG
jgi:hypothetical protein